jgi:two-component system, chemotaxis family, response regulator Rcp1
MTVETIEILLVEDNPGDVELTREAFEEGKIGNSLNVVGDGVEALRYLRREGQYNDVLRPDIVLLDLNLPKKGGLEVLSELKADPALRSIPVVVLTTSRAEEDIARSYHAHANCYISKPVDFDKFMQVVRALENFWLTVVRLPPK